MIYTVTFNPALDLSLIHIQMCIRDRTEVDKVAVGVDIRNGEQLSKLNSQLDTLCELGIEYEILFLDADDELTLR